MDLKIQLCWFRVESKKKSIGGLNLKLRTKSKKQINRCIKIENLGWNLYFHFFSFFLYLHSSRIARLLGWKKGAKISFKQCISRFCSAEADDDQRHFYIIRTARCSILYPTHRSIHPSNSIRPLVALLCHIKTLLM